MSSLLNMRRKRNPSSNVDLSHFSRGTMMPGVVYPVSFVDVLPGDVFTVRPSAFIQALPLKAPLMGSFDICLEMFFAPDRLYQKELYNNSSRAVLDPSKVKFHSYDIPGASGGISGTYADLDQMLTDSPVVEPNSLADFVGLPVGFIGAFISSNPRPSVNMNRAFMYVDTIRNYYANPQEYFIPTASLSSDKTPVTNSVSSLDTFATWGRSHAPGSGSISGFNYNSFVKRGAMLFCRTLAPERLDTWLDTSQYDLNAGKVSVQVEENEVILTDARFGSHVLRYLELALAGGGRYDDFLGAQFDVDVPADLSVPRFLGSMRSTLAFDKVMQNSAGTEDSPLGNFAGEGSQGQRFRPRRFSFREYGTFMVCLSLRPRVDYQLGFDPMLLKMNLESKFAPALDRIGFQPLMACELNALPRFRSSPQSTSGVDVEFLDSSPQIDPFRSSVGYQPAWSEYKSVSSRLHGKLTASMRYWTLSRLYSTNLIDNTSYKGARPDWSWLQYLAFRNHYRSTYVIPQFYNFAFADVDPEAENFIYQVAMDIRARRQMSKINMPNFI